jgi:hypothetical protein
LLSNLDLINCFFFRIQVFENGAATAQPSCHATQHPVLTAAPPLRASHLHKETPWNPVLQGSTALKHLVKFTDWLLFIAPLSFWLDGHFQPHAVEDRKQV